VVPAVLPPGGQRESDPCQQIAYTIVHKLTKTAFGEYKSASDDGFAQGALEAAKFIAGVEKPGLYDMACLVK